MLGLHLRTHPLHLTPEQAHPLKFSYDTLAEECLDALNTISPPAQPAELPRNSRQFVDKEKRTGLSDTIREEEKRSVAGDQPRNVEEKEKRRRLCRSGTCTPY